MAYILVQGNGSLCILGHITVCTGMVRYAAQSLIFHPHFWGRQYYSPLLFTGTFFPFVINYFVYFVHCLLFKNNNTTQFLGTGVVPIVRPKNMVKTQSVSSDRQSQSQGFHFDRSLFLLARTEQVLTLYLSLRMGANPVSRMQCSNNFYYF